VVAPNSWMNQPGGFTERNGKVVSVRPFAVFFNRAWGYEAVHMLLAAYIVAGFVVAGVYAVGMLKGRTDRYHRLGFLIAFTVAAIVTPIQIFVGDLIARYVFQEEPAKFAAIEGIKHTSTHVPETLGGVVVNGRLQYGLRIPNAASLLAGFSKNTRIEGTDATPAAVRIPPHLVTVVHLSFDAMVAIGFGLLALAGWFAISWWRRRSLPRTVWFLRAASIAGVAAVVSLEAGWVVTEVGRQPWLVVGHLLTRDAVTTSGNVWLFFAATVAIYTAVGTGAVYVLRRMRAGWANPDGDLVTVSHERLNPVGASR
jgi:cytochrome d ubiquinol oxidase subunit I